MKDRQDNGNDIPDFYQRCVLAGLLVLSPRFVEVARDLREPARLGERPEDFGVNPALLPSTADDLGFTECEWGVLKLASNIIFSKVMVDYDPPNCSDEEETKALMTAALALDVAEPSLRKKR